MVPSFVAHICEVYSMSGSDDEHPALLPRIALRASLDMPSRQCANSTLEDAPPNGRSQASLQTCGAVSDELRVDINPKAELPLLDESSCEMKASVSDHRKVRPAVFDLMLGVPQLRDLLSAEHSAKVANECEDDRAFSPQMPEPDSTSFEVLDLQVGKVFRHKGLRSIDHRHQYP